MQERKNEIRRVALHLFAQKGFEAVSVSDIAGELGITKGALYRHYASKEDIFRSILQRMEQQDAEAAQANGVPAQTTEAAPETYTAVTLKEIEAFSVEMFHYWTEDPFAADFRRMLTVEQYHSSEMQALYHQYLGQGPMDYTADLFHALKWPNAQVKAAIFYGAMHLLYGVYDAASDKVATMQLAENCIHQILEKMKRETLWKI